jgi:hypothetical protein
MLNYSFEQHGSCAQIGNCTGSAVGDWWEPTWNGGNWFSNPCFGSSASFGVPQNDLGYQYARTGGCYAAFTTDTANQGQADYLTGILSDTLKTNIKYCVTFYVSLMDSEWWAISRIGAYFTQDSLCGPNSLTPLLYTPQIENQVNKFITDKIHWVPISGEFQAAGGEKYITIGDFHKTIWSDYDSVGHGGFIYGENTEIQTAYFVDDVYVRELTIAVAGKSDSLCLGDSVLIGKDTTIPGVSFHWSPAIGLSNPNIAQPMASPTVTTTYTLTVINDSIHDCNCADSVTKDMVTISVCSGINEITYNSISNIYPNPSSGVFTIEMKNEDGRMTNRIEVFNVLGQKVLAKPLLSHTINISNQPDGVYLIRVFSNEGLPIGQSKIVKGEL